MRLLFKRAIPRSDSPCCTQPHPTSPCCTLTVSTRPTGAEGLLALLSTACGAFLPPWAEGHAGTGLHLKKSLHRDISFKQQILFFSAWNHSFLLLFARFILVGAKGNSCTADCVIYLLPRVLSLFCYVYVLKSKTQHRDILVLSSFVSHDKQFVKKQSSITLRKHPPDRSKTSLIFPATIRWPSAHQSLAAAHCCTLIETEGFYELHMDS